MSFTDSLASMEEIIEDARRGRMIILVDAEDRENEGDLIIPAEKITPETVNFMAKYGRGLICLALTGDRADELALPLMSRENQSRHGTAFTASIEAREGVSTGISAADRAHTIAVAIDPAKGKNDIATPGHVFPLRAREGGVLVRAGHTEAAVDIARLAGLVSAGVICEIMNDDGTMARMPDLLTFAQQHGIRIGRIADLIAHRRRYETLVERVVETDLQSLYGGLFRMIVYRNTIEQTEHIALVKGDGFDSKPVPVRVHQFNILEDLMCDRGGRGGYLHAAMHMIGEEGRGVVVIIRERKSTGVSDRVSANREHGVTDASELRDIGIGAQILRDLGVRDMIVLSHSQRPLVGIEGYGLKVVNQRDIPLLAVADEV
jgi:3,4-dihydroxy 2-butanone 4-phosphate synthase/GTP cyclohydrolase II